MSTDNDSFEITNVGKRDASVRGKVDNENIDDCINQIGAKCLEMNHDRIQNGPKDLLGVPRTGHRKSFMEEESAKEKARVSLLRQCSALLKLNEQKYNKDALHRTFQDEWGLGALSIYVALCYSPISPFADSPLTTAFVNGFLEKIFRLFDLEGKNYLIQEDWIEFLKERLTEEKQLDFVEQVESVAYVLCGEGVVTPDSFQLILKNKVVTKKLLVAVDSDGDGSVTADEIMDFLSAVSTSRPRAGIDQSSVDRLEQLFRETVGDQREITSEHFQKIFVSKNSFFTKRVFQIFDEDNSGAISLQEFIAAVHRFGRQTPEDKIRFLFKVYDVDGDGLIQQNELQEVMRACMHENGMHFSEEQLCELTEAMFCDADLEGRGAITYEALRDQLSKHGGLLENLSISIDRWLVPPAPKPSSTLLTRLSSLKPYQMSFPYFKNNHVFVMYLLMFFVLNLALFVARIVEYWHSNVFVIFARACGQCLNFTCSWVLVLMLRCCITALRTRGIGSLLPLDHHIYLHKLTGVLILVYSVIHTIMHLCNFSVIVVNDPVLNANNYTLWEWIGSTKPGLFGLVGGCANPTGLALCFTLFILATCSRPAVRRGGCFEIFYFTHLLYIPFWVLLLFHAPNFWKWFIAPGTIYILERVLRLTWMRSERGKSYIASGILLPSRVTHLVVKRPSLFHFHAGDYVFVNIPDIASYEWHPFTISSAPDQEDYIWLHIRGVGQWTNRLYEYFEMEQQRLHANTHQVVNRTHSGESCKSAISRRKGSGASKPRSVDFSPLAFDNTAFCADESNTFKALSPLQNTRSKFLSPMKFLEKSHSMPDVFNNKKKKLKPNFPPESLRCGSELYIAEIPRRRITGGTRDAALAHSFRYMRTKPTIISCRPPDERRRSNESILSLARRRFSKSRSPERDVEKEAPVIQEESPDSGCEDYPSGKPLEIYLDGPYGAASSHIFRAQHAVLIAAGIGVTPFASILQAIMYKYRHARVTCPNCSHTWPCRPRTDMTLRKVDFFWINREQRSFEWFVSLLSQLEIEQAEAGDAERFLEMHMYITSALQRSDMKAVGLQLALDLLHEKEKRDLITGLKTRTNAGRPNWDKVFQRLQEQGKGKVTVFYCGPPLLARVLRVKCDQFGFDFRKEVF